MEESKTLPTVAIVYDKVTAAYGGAEEVLKALLTAFPGAPLYTSVFNPTVAQWARGYIVKTTFLQHIPRAAALYKALTPLMPLAFESLDLSSYDIVISVTSDQAKAVLTSPKQLHVCYLLTPPRYLYSHQKVYQETESLLSWPVVKAVAQPLFSYLRWFDQVAVFRPDCIIPISNRVTARVLEQYGVAPHSVVYPPLPAQPRSTAALKSKTPFLLAAARLVAYKRIDLAVSACLETGDTLCISGVGAELATLQKLAGSKSCTRNPAESLSAFFERAERSRAQFLFCGHSTQLELAQLYAAARAYVLPGLEDFGIAALEAASYGTPSILQANSGVTELLPEPLSIHLNGETVSEVVRALQKLTEMPSVGTELKQTAEQHELKNFTTQFTKIVYDLFIQKKHSSSSVQAQIPSLKGNNVTT